MGTNSATISWNGSHWVAELNGTRYADCNNNRLTERLYNDGAEMVYKELTTPQRKTVWERVRHAAASMWRRCKLSKGLIKTCK